MENNLTKELENELEKVFKENLLSKEQIRSKLSRWLFRNVLTYVFIYYFWDYYWVKISLFLLIPLSLFSLLMIVGSNYLLLRKLKSAQKSIDKLKEKFENQ